MLNDKSVSTQTMKALYGNLISISLPCEGISTFDFLSQQQPRFYWRRGDITLAGIGKALEINAIGASQIDEIRMQVAALFENATIHTENPLAAPRLFGGFSFLKDFVPDHIWSIYLPSYFILPHYQFLSIEGKQWLTLNVQLPPEDNSPDTVDELKAALRDKITQLQQEKTLRSQHFAAVVKVDYPMPFEKWAQNIEDVIHAIDAGQVEKVVLARVCEMTFSENPDLLDVLAYLGDHYPECNRFLFEPRAGYAFLGATPETLLNVSDGQFETMGLAGSIRRGETPDEDAGLANELLNSVKDRHEQHLVVETIIKGLEGHVDDLTVGETEILTLSNIQHIHTPINAILKPTEDILSLLSVLHPTPALGGKPRDKAIQMIGELEPVPRGWYAAPIGWLDGALNGQFGVAIRSAVVQEKRVWLYAGAGIVKGSEPQKEWDETALKFRPMLKAFTHHLPS